MNFLEWITAAGAFLTAVFTCWLAVTAKKEFSEARIAAQKAVDLERSKWAAQLSQRFFGPEFREIREVMDVDAAHLGPLSDWVGTEDERLTECLNLFELIAYLEASKQITWADVQAIFCYYLRCLKRHAVLLHYISDERNSYEHLKRLLDRI